MFIPSPLFARACGLVLGAAAAALALPAVGTTIDDSPIRLLAERERIMEHMERLPEHKLKRAYLLCAHVAGQRMLDHSEAAVCSMTGEVLKKTSFDGDFDALLAWWREHRHTAPTSESLDSLLSL